MSKETIWLAIGFLGQALFSARFLVQWLKSEKERKSVFP
ncbi:MAG: lipid-A-disaccharide synthase N-terminal domain-containing protein, partial [Methylobacter sp.]